MQGNAPFSDWLSDPKNQQIAELLWSIKHTEAQLYPLISNTLAKIDGQVLLNRLDSCRSLYQQLAQYYLPVELSLSSDILLGNDIEAICSLCQQHSLKLRQSPNSEEKACSIAMILNCLNKLVVLQQQSSASLVASQVNQCLSLEHISTWFLSFVDLIRHQYENPSWANEFFQKLRTSAYHELYQMLVHPDTSHLMFHIYYYKLFPDQLSSHSKHPEILVSLDQRLSFLYQNIEQFVETFILYSKNHYQLSPKNFLCHGNQLPKGITLRSKETFRQLIIKGLKKLNSKVIITEQSPTADIIDSIFRAYQFWFNPCRLLDAVFILSKRLKLSIEQPYGTTLFQHMVKELELLDTDACIHLYGYFSNNDTRYLLRVLYFISVGGTLTKLPTLSEGQKQLIDLIYHAFTQIIDAVSDSLNTRNLPCKAIKVTASSKPPSPGKRNLQAIQHVITTYSSSAESGFDLDQLFAEVENDPRKSSWSRLSDATD